MTQPSPFDVLYTSRAMSVSEQIGSVFIHSSLASRMSTGDRGVSLPSLPEYGRTYKIRQPSARLRMVVDHDNSFLALCSS
jgi:hypothetical protein